MAKTPSGINFQPLENALASLENALQSPPANDLERDGVIQRFEYTFELSWKSIRVFLTTLGRANVSGCQRPLFRDALDEGLIASFEQWNRYLEARNQSTHTYSTINADEVYRIATGFPEPVHLLLSKMKEKLKSLQ